MKQFAVAKQLVYLFSLCAVLVAATSAFAVPQKQLLTVTINQTFTGACCFSWGETVFVNEGTKLTPVTVRFATDFLQDTIETFTVGIMVNGGACRIDMGPNELGDFAVDGRGFMVGSIDWVVLPEDGLFPGLNSFTLCGGGSLDTSKITLGNNTFAVRTTK
jgi:hypothetical protein